MFVIVFIILLAVLILAHEFGHFILAKRAGIRVDEFGLGFPPRIWSKTVGETKYSINLIPFGGFVKIYGEDNESLLESGNVDRERSFVGQPKITQASVIAAGIVFNMILGWILFSSAHLIGFPSIIPALIPEEVNVQTQITEVAENSPAAQSGLKKKDTVLSIQSYDNTGGALIQNPSQKIISEFVSRHEGVSIKFKIVRAGATKEIEVVPQKGIIAENKDKVVIGIGMEDKGEPQSFVNAFYYGGITLYRAISFTAQSIVELVRGIGGGTMSISAVSGPIGIAELVKSAMQLGFNHLLFLAGIISVNLGVMNVIPFPALDGGRLLFIVIESIKRKPISARTTNIVNVTGFALLMILMIVVSYYDVLKIIAR